MNAPSPVPSGALALVGDIAHRQRRVERACLERLEQAGYREVLLPVLEFADGEERDGYRFLDGEGRLLALRTDFTPLAARILAPCLATVTLPFSVCYSGEVLRPRPPRLRQVAELYQLGFERYGEEGGGEAALSLMLDLVTLAGVSFEWCHLTVSRAGMAEEVLRRVGGAADDPEPAKLLQARDVDGLVAATGVEGEVREALEAALLAAPAEQWAGVLGVAAEVTALEPVLAVCRSAGLAATVDVAPRLAGDYYTGTVFSLLGGETRGVIAGGGEYAVQAGSGSLAAAGACLSLGTVLQEAVC